MAAATSPGADEARWICLSDLHLGAESSVLTALRPDAAEPDLGRPSPALTALVACLRSLRAAAGPPPTLVIAGDLLDLALSPSHVAATTFEHFARAVLAGPSPLVDDTVWLVPGNHDHHLWEAARDRSWSAEIDRLDADRPVPPAPSASSLLPTAHHPVAGMLTSLARRASGRGSVRVRIAYPNLGLQGRDGRVVVVSHGHFAEPIYRLMSTLRRALFPHQPPAATVAQWESDNGAWIDFLWSTLGQSGQVGTDVAVLYDLLQEPAALESVVDRAVVQLTDEADHGRARAHATREVVERMVGIATHHARVRERTRPHGPLSPQASAGLDEWLAGPVRRQVDREAGAATVAGVVFGHTHKPFEAVRDVAGWREMPVLNTGGWVVDTLTPDPARGASIVLVGADLDTVAVHVPGEQPVEAPGVEVRTPGDGASPLPASTRERVAAHDDRWKELVSALDQGARRRRRELARVIRARGAIVPR